MCLRGAARSPPASRQPFEELKGGFPARLPAPFDDRGARLAPDLPDRMMKIIVCHAGRDFAAIHKDAKPVQRVDERESGDPPRAELRLEILPGKTLGQFVQRAKSLDQIAGLQHLDELQRNLGFAGARRDADLPRAKNAPPTTAAVVAIFSAVARSI